MIYLQLFLAFLNIGMFSFGGGYAAMPLIQGQVIEKYGWMTMQQFTDLVTIAEMTPGPIAVNASTFVGNVVAGIPGALVATFGCILPSCIIVTLLAFLYAKYGQMKFLKTVLLSLRPAVIAAILASGITILISAIFYSGTFSFNMGDINVVGVILFVGALIVLQTTKLSPILVMVSTGVIQVILYFISLI